MLTKDLLKYRNKKGLLSPQFLSVNEKKNQELTTFLLNFFKKSIGKTKKEVLDQVELSPVGHHDHCRGLVKLLQDRCTEEDDDGEIYEQRKKWLQEAQSLRQNNLYHTLEEFQEAFATLYKQPYSSFAKAVFSDLPDQRAIKEFEDLDPMALIHRYNCALVQGLLVRSTSFSVSFEKLTLVEKRYLFRRLKFHQLMAQVSKEKSGKLTVDLGGAFSLFQKTQTYGTRVANFFPHVVNLSKWVVTATVTINRRDLTMKISHDQGLVSHYPKASGYIPRELQDFLQVFNEKSKDWQAEVADDFINVGQQSYCFPDLSFTHKKVGIKVHAELFHKWHQHQLQERLRASEHTETKGLMIGVCKSLLKKDDLSQQLNNSSWFSKYSFAFDGFPTTNVLLKALKRFV